MCVVHKIICFCCTKKTIVEYYFGGKCNEYLKNRNANHLIEIKTWESFFQCIQCKTNHINIKCTDKIVNETVDFKLRKHYQSYFCSIL